ncbi:ATP-binding protein [Hymenobacter sp. BT770]|uniref:sensor histidine kinase n=1 Tax=Hymenobacter sp. BT770 TaxID=2886942 RepID=UPI002672C751|nr:ATP-binding protein [Hymenobacter sp. BT770]MDO3416394.1 ATP-binding protein [Hymenobacter sp. BT770]
MRYFFLLVAGWLLALPAGAAPLPADTAVQPITRLPADGLLLTQGWRYHAGDDPTWARPDFDDSRWDTLNPTRPRRELPTRLHTGLGWLRLRFQLGDSLRLRALLLQTTGNGAWELYLDGQRLQRQGTLDPAPHRVRVNPHPPEPLELPATGRAGHVLAVRFAPWHHPLLHQSLDEALVFSARLQGTAQRRKATAEQAAAGPVFLALGSVVGLLMLLHLAFFYYNPARRANLYFALYTGALSLGALGVYSTPAVPFSSPVERLAFELLTWLLLVSSGLWAARALYALFGFRPGWLYAGLCVCCGALLAYSVVEVVHHGFQNGAFFGFMMAIVLATAEQLRLTGRALRQRRGGAAIIGVGFAAALLAVLGFIAIVTSATMYSSLVSALMYPLMFLPPALAISLFLAREFALDAQLLQVKLGEVETLSAQTLAQEQEKQALLAAQNETLETQVAQRTGELQRSLTELRATQAQLIQKEKMASLGELTAGIAHEIQNPLNFVNNFSEVSTELVEELQEALAASDTAEAAELARDVAQNLSKIIEHGKRAAAIVKGMLEHSRTSTGERAPTDLNALCQEYLRLAYQGLRAKDKSFNAELITDFAADLPLVEVVGADLGRVLLNLFANAFYAVHQRQQLGVAGHRPTVEVRTRLAKQRVEIRVQDNGTGMSNAVQAKIFQPFFTTKPTGEGTGLGLSLSYDIITQGHGGTLSVESHEGQGTSFIISLPA